jgi:hypothetical protein
MTAESKRQGILEQLESLKEQSLSVFETAHRLRQAILEMHSDGIKDDGDSVVIEFQRFLKKRNK